MRAIDKAIKAVGSQTKLAAIFGITPQSVQQWSKSGQVPADRVIGIEQATLGKVSRHELRPDLYPKELNPQQAA